jgi:predicted transcriptional regulator
VANKARVGIQLNVEVDKKLQEFAEKYGMSKNSLITYILGQWVDANYELKDKITGRLLEMVKEHLGAELGGEKE